MNIKQKTILITVISVPFLAAGILFYYLWVYMPYIYELDIDKVKTFPLNSTETVEGRVNSIEGPKKITWVSGEFFPCASVKLIGSEKVDLCFVISDGVLYAKNEDTIKYFPELKISFKAMH